MLTIYGRKSSANVQKVHWICLEGNLKFKAINIGGKYGGHTSNEFKQINPNSTIPVLKDNDFIIYESNSIIKYISENYNILKSNNKKNIISPPKPHAIMSKNDKLKSLLRFFFFIIYINLEKIL